MSYLSGEASPVVLTPPQGLEEICTTFGDIFEHIANDHTLAAGADEAAVGEFLQGLADSGAADRELVAQGVLRGDALAATDPRDD